jgi:hypothetical protein
MANNSGTIKRVTRKRTTAPKTARKPRLSAEAVAELGGAPPVAAPVPEVVLEVVPAMIVEEAPAPPAPAPPAPEPPPARAVTVVPERRFGRVAFVRAMLHRLRLAAERRAAPVARRLEARFPRLGALRALLRRWI